MRFQQFASVEYEGVIYMTPQDFLESITEESPRRMCLIHFLLLVKKIDLRFFFLTFLFVSVLIIMEIDYNSYCFVYRFLQCGHKSEME